MNTNVVLTKLPEGADDRKALPIATGVVDYFPLALAEVARISKMGNDQHNPGQPLHWARGKSTDHEDCLLRHFIQRGTLDSDGARHTAKLAWRALAMLQTEMEDLVGFEREPKVGGATAKAHVKISQQDVIRELAKQMEKNLPLDPPLPPFDRRTPILMKQDDRCVCGGVGCNSCEPQGRG